MEKIDELEEHLKKIKEKFKEKSEFWTLVENKLDLLEKEKKMWNIVVDHHGDEVDINVDKLYVLNTNNF